MNHTPCKDCIFAIYEGNTQILCEKGLIPKYRNLGYNIVEVYDDDKDFYVIEGRKCIYFRNNKWLDFKYNTDEEYYEGINKKISSELQLKYTAIVYIDAEKTFEDAKKTLSSIFNSDILPENIVLVYQNNSQQLSNKTKLPAFSDDIAWCNDNLKGVKFTIQYLTNNPSLHEMISYAASKAENAYILLESGKELTNYYIYTIYDHIINKLYPVLAAKHEDDSYHELFIFKSFSSMIGDFGEKSAQEKINEVISDAKTTEDKNKCSQMFLVYEQI